MAGESFDPIAWQRETGCQALREAQPGLVVDPVDVLEIIESRRRLADLGFVFGDPSPTDVSVFSMGEAPSRSQTKFGGLPYLLRHDPWPLGRDGNPLPFVGQFDFRASMDIAGQHAKGDLLLIFGDLPSDENPAEIQLLWKTVADEGDLVGANEVPCWPAFDAFYGTRWRTANFPMALDEEKNERFFDGDSEVADPWLACTLFATQIGPHPFLLARESVSEHVLCCCAPIIPVTDGPFPFLGHEEPLYSETKARRARLLESPGMDWTYDQRYRFVDQWLTYGDSTSLYILEKSDGVLTAEFIHG